MKYTLSEKLKIAEKVCDLYAEGGYTLESCCNAVGININTFYQSACPMVEDFNSLSESKQKELLRRGFVQEIQHFLKKAKKTRKINYKLLLLDHARIGLLKLIQGYVYEETHSIQVKNENGEEEFKPVRKIQKYVPPNVAAVIFALKSTDPENFSDKVELVSYKLDPQRERISKLTNEELEAEIKKLEDELKEADDDLNKRRGSQ